MNIGEFYGAFAFGIILNVMLYGVVLAGYFHYALDHHKDAIWIRCYILFLFVADTAHTAFSIAFLYDGLVEHFGDLAYLRVPSWLATTVPAITGIISCAVQLFFTHRVKRLSRQTWLAVAIGTLAVVSMLSALANVIAVRWKGFHKFESLQRAAIKVPISLWLMTGLVADILIMLSLVWHLHRKRTGFSSTDFLINRIIRLTVETGVLTTSWALIDVTLYLASHTDIHIFFNFSLAKLYTILLMSSLNARGGWEPSYVDTSELSWNPEAGHIPQGLSMGTVDDGVHTNARSGRDRSQTVRSVDSSQKGLSPLSYGKSVQVVDHPAAELNPRNDIWPL